MFTFINDSFIKEEDAVLHFKDLSIMRGYGVFDFFKVVDKLPFYLDNHLDRFYFSAKEMHLPVLQNRGELIAIITALIKKNDAYNCGIRITLTGGYSDDGIQIVKPNLIISQHSYQPPTKEQFEKGIHLLTYPYQRQISQAKTIDYTMAIWLQPLLQKHGADDILYHQNGMIRECPRSNFFMITEKDKIITPFHHILKGITRKRVLEIGAKNFEVEEKEITLNDIKTAKECFITSTTKGILPIRQIDQTTFGNYRPVTAKLASLI
jgi:D-alanine transaminase/branched-chain amino acid aminotransferase